MGLRDSVIRARSQAFAAMLAGGLFAAGCSVPGTSSGAISVRGRLMTESGRPIAGEPLHLVLPATYQPVEEPTARWKPAGFVLARRADDAYSLDTRRRRNAASPDPVGFQRAAGSSTGCYGLEPGEGSEGRPEVVGATDRVIRLTTDEEGRFRHEIERVVYDIDLWFLPPLGSRPGRPPPPYFAISLPRHPGEYYRVRTSDGEYRVFESGSRTLVSEPVLVDLIASHADNEARDGATVAFLELRFPD